MFGYYRVGAKLSSDIVIPISEGQYDDGENIISRARWLHKIANKTPGKSRSLLKGANFVARNKSGTWGGYFAKGTEGK